MSLDTNSLIVYGIVGLVAGFLSTLIVKTKSLGVLGMLVIGIIGAFLGAWLFDVLEISLNINIWVDRILVATIGAIIVLWLFSLVQSKKKD